MRGIGAQFRNIVRRYSIASYTGKQNANGKFTVPIIEGDGIGPEISAAVKKIFGAANAPIEWVPVDVTPSIVDGVQVFPKRTVDLINEHKVALKGPLATPIGKGHVSLNLTLRRTFNLFANVRPCKSIEGYNTAYSGVNTVLIRENTEGEYSGIEHAISPGVIQSIKLITAKASERVCEYAFNYANEIGKKKVLVVHKASVLKLGDGLFVSSAEKVAKKFPDIELCYELIDNTCLKMVQDPSYYEDFVMVMPNLYGDIMSDLCSGLIGGLGLTPSGNMGIDVSIFEAVHGSAPDIAGKNMANPTALLLSSVMMLRYMNLPEYADKIEKAVLETLASGKDNITKDLKGNATTEKFTSEVISRL